MTRPKTRPQIKKPDFTNAAIDKMPGSSALPKMADTGKEKDKRLPLILQLKQEVIARLELEAGRKDRSIAQVVEKLVSKHLDKK